MKDKPWNSELRLDADLLQEYRLLDAEGSPSILDGLLERFQTSFPERLGQVEESVRKRESRQLFHAAHALKNICGNVGARRLARICRELEDRGAAESWDDVPELLRLVSEEAVATRRELGLRFPHQAAGSA